MSRCIRKVENENWYIVYCNTIDRVFPLMFDSMDTATLFVEYFDTSYDMSELLSSGQGTISKQDILDEVKKNG